MAITFETNRVYSENEIINMILNKKPNTSLTNIKWILFKLEKNKILTRVGTKKYISNAKIYDYELESDISKDVNNWLDSNYKNVEYIIWETRILNEWLNQLIFKNIVVIEVENEYEEIIFFDLVSAFPSYMFLLNPTNDLINKYLSKDLVIVKTMYTRSPIKKKKHRITIEKILVDILADKNISNILDSHSVIDIITGIKSNYDINTSKVITYAKRRRCLDKFIDLWGGISD